MENSKILLQKAIDILEEADIKDDEWAVGGGTVLAHYYNFFDIFTYSAGPSSIAGRARSGAARWRCRPRR